MDLRDRIKAYEDAGVDEVLLDPSVAALDQVDRAADVVFGWSPRPAPVPGR
jgi:hypothetical protein